MVATVMEKILSTIEYCKIDKSGMDAARIDIDSSINVKPLENRHETPLATQ
jgi:hypothetical protein